MLYADIWMYHIERAVKGTGAGLQSLEQGVWAQIQKFVAPFLAPRWMTNLILRVTRARIEGKRRAALQICLALIIFFIY